MNVKNKLDNRGFSLIELLVCLAISAFVILAAYSLVMVGTKSYDLTSKNADLQQEVSYTNNLLGEIIISAKQESTKIEYSNNGKIIMFYTGSKVIYYNQTQSMICVYNQGDVYGTDVDNHLVTKYATEFILEFVPTDASLTTTDTLDADGNGILNAYTKLVKVHIKFDIKGKTDTSEIVYQIRNFS